MVNAVVPDGIETDLAPPRGMPGGGSALALLLAGVVALFVVSGGKELPAAPVDTLPALESVLAKTWNRIDLPGSGPITAVDTTSFGVYVAAGAGPRFWWSGDEGQTWEPGRESQAQRGEITGIVTLGDGRALAVGTNLGAIPVIWRSEDGKVWESQTIFIHGPGGLDGVAFADGRFVAWGWTGAAEDFAPGVGPLLLTSRDGITWDRIEGPGEGVRIHRVVEYFGGWLAMGSAGGRPALWQGYDLSEWEAVPSVELPFGWAMVGVRTEPLIATLLDVGGDRTREWQSNDDGTWSAYGPEIIEGPASLAGDTSRYLGVGSGHLWVGEKSWTDAGLDGTVHGVAGNVAVGEADGHPAIWLRNP